MEPGISRATMGGILGFIVGAAIVVALRIIFGFEPYWNLELVLVLSAFMTAYGVIWGIGGFNPKMSQHPDDSVPPPTIDEMAEKAGPGGMVTHISWQMAFISVVMMAILIGVALIPGVGINVTSVPSASVKDIGVETFQIFGGEIVVNQAFLLLGWILFTILSLAITGGAIAFIFFFLNQEVETVKTITPPPAGEPREVPRLLSPVMRRAGNVAGALADRIAPKSEGQESTAVVVKKDN